MAVFSQTVARGVPWEKSMSIGDEFPWFEVTGVFGINGGELMVLLVVVAIVIGPARLPQFAEQLGKLVRNGRSYLSRIRQEMVAEAGDESLADWADLDPRKYDPRRIVRDALRDESADPALSQPNPGGHSGAGRPQVMRLAPGQRPPWDAEAT
ncbi:sec-independent protein translocase protein TatB [Micrococcales bacterium KH10]|nr:sec-independent protein translocase protein TatB [Micrococcales bacterium KH10]